jgi:hypothetical protein
MTQANSKPAVYLVVILPVMVGGSLAVITTVLSVYRAFHGAAIPQLNGFLLTIPTFFLWLPFSLLISNFILFVVSPLRRIAETYVSKANRPGFRKSQTQLLRITGVLAVICVPLIVLGLYL